MRSLCAIYALCLVLSLATQAAALCYNCGPGGGGPPPVPGCTNGVTRSCSIANGCPGTQTCSNGRWSSCSDAGQCTVGLGCPLSRETSHVPVSPGGEACTSGLVAKPGESIHVNSSPVTNSTTFTLFLHQPGASLPPVPISTQGVFDFKVSYYGLYFVCADNTDWLFTHWIRITMDVAGNESSGVACDEVPDTCFGYRGPDCGLCTDTGRQDNLVWCAAQVGSQKHDTCCAHYPGGYMCGNTGYDGLPVANQFCEPPTCYPPSGYNLPYQMCTAEWDKAVHDWDSFNEWNTLTDPTLLYYRPLSNYATQESDGHWISGHPTEESIRFPDGQKVEYGDGEWCANGYHTQAVTGYVICGPE